MKKVRAAWKLITFQKITDKERLKAFDLFMDIKVGFFTLITVVVFIWLLSIGGCLDGRMEDIKP